MLMRQSIRHLGIGLALLLAGFASQVLAQSTPVEVAGFEWEASTKNTPAVATLGKTVYLAWTGSGSADDIWFSSYNGTDWSTQQVVEGSGWTAESSAAPALSVDASGVLWLAWKGKTTNTISFSSWNGTSWATPQEVIGSGWTAETSTAPALMGGEGFVVVAWKGKSTNQNVWFSIGSPWEKQLMVEDILGAWVAKTNVAPNFASGGADNYPFLFWKGESSDHIYLSTYDNGWTQEIQVSCGKPIWTALTDAAPTSAFMENTKAGTYSVFWKGKGATSLWYTYETTATSCGWAKQAVVKGSGWSADTSLAPAVASNSASSSILVWVSAAGNIWYIDPTTLPGLTAFAAAADAP
jgi:hypothetical protein